MNSETILADANLRARAGPRDGARQSRNNAHRPSRPKELVARHVSDSVLSDLPPPCPICGTQMVERFSATILGRYDAPYDQCPACELFQVRAPCWLDEAYEQAICLADTGILARNLHIADALSALLPRLHGNGPYLDFGSGLGVLVRLMRDRGFNFRWSDRYADNQLARGFEYGAGDPPCSAVTAFEVLEHVEDPAAFLTEALTTGQCRTLIFTTDLHPGPAPAPDWWYYARDEGQHITFYSRRSLDALAARFGLRCLSNGWLHMITDQPIDEPTYCRALRRPARLLARLRPRPSLVAADNAGMLARVRASRIAD